MSATKAADNPRLIMHGGLPAKISGIVFWGMVLVGLLAAMILLHGQKRDQLSRDAGNALLLTNTIGDGLRRYQGPSLLRANHKYLLQAAERLRKTLGFEAVEIVRPNHPNHRLRFGEIRPSQFVITHTLVLPSIQPDHPLRRLRVRVYFPSIAHSVTTQRNHLMLVMGLVMILFGLVLQKILQYLLSRPFASMVASARKFADGDTGARIYEGLPDEFGFLAQFVNRALDSLTQQQVELKAAVTRAEQSEAALFREKERAEVMLYSITDAVIAGDEQGLIQYVNPVAERLTGWSNDEARGVPLETVLQIVHDTTREHLPHPAYACLHNNAVETIRDNAALLRRDGGCVAIEVSAAPMHNSQGVVVGVVMVFQDVRHARHMAAQLSYQANHDALTGLLNRSRFEKILDDLVASVRESGQVHALFYLDMDQFKIVNDTCGHVAGDELLRQISVVLREGIRKQDILARLGGDEFGVLLADCPLARAIQIAEQLRQHIKALRFVWQDKTFEVGVSIGVVAITASHLDSASLLGTADLSCYAAKDMGRNRIHIYQPTDETLARRHREMRWTSRIVEALEANHFRLFRQVIRGLTRSGANLEYYEVLIRMQGDDGHLIMPSSFIPAAERYNLMPSIDRWVIRNTFSTISENGFWRTGRGNGRMVAINLSGASLDDEGLLDFIRTSHDEFGTPFNEICFEITETVAISNLVQATHLITELRTLGCRFALDDFGSGLSSFGYLKSLPVDYIKIDGRFVKDIVTDPVDRAIVETINEIGQMMRIQTMAEWVEDEATLTVLREIGVDFAQGHHIGKPRAIPSRGSAVATSRTLYRET
ncbi:MAG: EAL domain-containing protein [Acidiferrobacteraceae bacterium]